MIASQTFLKTLLLVQLVLCGLCQKSSAQDPPAKAPPGVVIEKDLDFLGADREEKLDLYRPKKSTSDDRLPAVVIIHGGGWAKGDKYRMREYVSGTSLAKAGYVAVSINYQTKAKKRWPNNLHDCKNAVRWLRTNSETLGVDPDRIGVIGGSAGGHLALMVAYTGDDPELSPKAPYPDVSDKVLACVNMYGITNLATRKVAEDDGTPTDELKTHRLFKESLEEAPEKWKLASPVTHITGDSPPTLTFHGTKDHVVDRDQAKELHAKLVEAGVDSTLRMVKGARHAWPLKTKDFDFSGDMVSFFNSHLKAAGKPKAKRKRKSQPATLPETSDGRRRPNVLFIAVDDLNDWEHSLGGHPLVKTPNMDRLFKKGVLFTNAHCSQAVCNASRNSVLSGLHPSSSGWYGSTNIMRATFDEVMEGHKMMPQYFRDNGYYTLTAGKIYHQGASDFPERTVDFWNEIAPGYKVPKSLRKRGNGYKGSKFYPFPKNGSQIVQHYGKDYEDGNSLCGGPLDPEDIPDGKMYDELIAEWAIEKLSQDHDKPFFMAVGFVRPHVPFTAPRKYFDMYDFKDIKRPQIPDNEMSDIPLMGKSIAYGRIKGGDHHAVTNLSDQYWEELTHSYLACVSFVDDQIGRVVDALEKSKFKDDTIIVLWSDHGQHLGEKHHWRKQTLWEEATRVPLFIKVPGVESAGQTCDHTVSLLDIYPTLVESCELPTATKLEGTSLLPLLENPASAARRSPVVSSWYYGNFAVRSDSFRYIQYRDGTEEFYDHRADPNEYRNVAADAQYKSLIEDHRKWIPEEPALPAGTSSWPGDKLDRRIEDWEKGEVPAWLK